MRASQKQLFFDKEEVRDVGALLGKFGPGAFASPYRSTVPLLSLAKDQPSLFANVVQACGCAEALAIHFEYQVAVPGVEGNPSQTDAMVVSPTCTVALEAKWTEPRYKTVAARLQSRIAKLTRDDPHNADKHVTAQRSVIAAWINLLGRRARKPLDLEQAGETVYQMIHRAASACHMPGTVALAYLHFEPSPAKGAVQHLQYKADLTHLYSLLGAPEEFPFYLVSMPLRLTAAFEAIKDLPKGEVTTDRAVRNAILTTQLFEFGDPHVERVK